MIATRAGVWRPARVSNRRNQGRSIDVQHHARLPFDDHRHPAARLQRSRCAQGHHCDRRRLPRAHLRRNRSTHRAVGECVAAHRRHRRPAGRHLHVEQLRTPGGVSGGSRDGCGAAYPQHPAVPRADRLRRQRGRRPGGAGRRVAGHRAGADPRRTQDRAHRDRGGRRRYRRTRRIGQDRTALRRRRRRRVGRIRLARHRRKLRGRNVLHQRHHRQPQRCCLQPPLELSAHDGDLHQQRDRDRLRRLGVADRADVPRQRLGPAVRGADGRRGPGVARSASGRQVAGRHDREAAPHRRRRGADHLERRHALPRKEPRPRRVVAADGSHAAARPCRCR